MRAGFSSAEFCWRSMARISRKGTSRGATPSLIARCAATPAAWRLGHGLRILWVLGETQPVGVRGPLDCVPFEKGREPNLIPLRALDFNSQACEKSDAWSPTKADQKALTNQAMRGQDFGSQR